MAIDTISQHFVVNMLDDLKEALYFVCCRLQELESRIDKGLLSGKK